MTTPELRASILAALAAFAPEPDARSVSFDLNVPFHFSAVDGFQIVKPSPQELENREAGEPETRAEDGSEKPPGTEGAVVYIEGIASSTSIDSHGTRMSLGALEAMRAQFMGPSGVAYLPRHGSWLSRVEWDEVMGRSVDAWVVPGDVINGKVGDPGHKLRVRLKLYAGPRDLKTLDLIERIKRGEPIGQSIGGWFTRVTVTYNDEGDVTDVVVDMVELDHLALTRSPSNPDSVGLALAEVRSVMAPEIRSKIQALKSKNSPPPTEPEGSPTGNTSPELETRTAPGVLSGEPETVVGEKPAGNPLESGDRSTSESTAQESAMSLTDEIKNFIQAELRSGLAGVTTEVRTVVSEALRGAEPAKPAPVAPAAPAPGAEDWRTKYDLEMAARRAAEAKVEAAERTTKAMEDRMAKAAMDERQALETREIVTNLENDVDVEGGLTKLATRAVNEGHSIFGEFVKRNAKFMDQHPEKAASRDFLAAGLRAAIADGSLVLPE